VRKTVQDIRAQKGQTPLVMLTASTAPMAQTLDPYCDLLLVGDSLGMVLYGMENTLGVTPEMMITHGAAVVRGSAQAFVVVDMCYGSYEDGPAQALATAQRIGLLPQSVEIEGGYKIKGKSDEDAARLIKDAQAVEAAGAFSIVIEGTVEPVSRDISAAVSIPTIGIGASNACDGQVLVSEDMLGMLHGKPPKFAKEYAVLRETIADAARRYADEVRAHEFPGEAYVYHK